MSESLPCIVCDMPLESVFPGVVNQPSGGTAFKTMGHYGSTVFDSFDESEFLEVNICDDCLKKAGRKGQVIHTMPSYYKIADNEPVEVEEKVEIWTGE